jgi:hypothetical protein
MGQVETERELYLHEAICTAVELLFLAPDVHRCKEGRQAYDVLRQVLVTYADDCVPLSRSGG